MIEFSSTDRGRSTARLTMQERAARAVGAAISAGVSQYHRQTSLPALLPLLPSEIADASDSMHRRIVARLARALRAERMRGRAGHWSYDINRHIALRQAYEAERGRLRRIAPSGR